MKLNELEEVLIAAIKETNIALSDKRTKAGTKRLRVILGSIKASVPKLRSELMELDKK